MNALERTNKESHKFKLRRVKVVVHLCPATFKFRSGEGRALDLANLGVLPEEYEGGKEDLGS